MELNVKFRGGEARCRVCAVLHRPCEPHFKYFILEEISPADPNNRFHAVSRLDGQYRETGGFRCQKPGGELTEFVREAEIATPMSTVTNLGEDFVVESISMYNAMDDSTIVADNEPHKMSETPEELSGAIIRAHIRIEKHKQ